MLKLSPQPVKYRGTLTGLRISSVDGTAFIDNAADGTVPLATATLLHTGAVARADMRLSTVAGTAFVDSNAGDFATNITAHAGKYLMIKDSAGKYVKGWIKAAGAGEEGGDLGDEIVTNPSFDDNSTGWTPGRGSIASSHPAGGGQVDDFLILTSDGQAGGPYATQSIAVPVGALYKFGVYVKSGTDGNQAYNVYRFQSELGITGTSSASWVLASGYATSPAATGPFYLLNHHAGNTLTMLFDEATLKTVTAPSTSGVTIQSTRAGAVENWESVESGFNPNDTTYTYYIYDRDITTFADGNHSIEIYDASGRMLKGVLKEAISVEVLGDEIISNNSFTGTWSSNVPQSWALSDGATQNGTNYLVGNDVNDTLQIICDGALMGIYQPFVTTANALYKFTSVCDSITAGKRVYFGLGSSIGSTLHIITEAGALTSYQTDITNGTTYLVRSPGYISDGVFSSVSRKQVTAPGAGATIVSAKGGTVYNFAYKNASFTYNASSYYTVIKKLRGRALNVSTTGTSPRISAVDDTAFIDNLPVGVTSAYMDGKHYLRVYDPNGKYIEGVLKEVGAAEGVTDIIGGTDPALLNGDFSLGDTGWNKGTGWTIVDQGGGDYEGVATNVAASITLSQAISGVLARLFKTVAVCTNFTSGSISVYGNADGSCIGNILTSTGTTTLYWTSTSNFERTTGVRSAENGTTLRVDNCSLQQVTAPSTAGCTIVNSISGTDYHWLTKETGFDYNNAGTYTFQVWSEY